MHKADVETTLENMKALGFSQVKVDGKGRVMDVALDKDVEWATDKEQVKIVPCRDCGRPIVVTTFFMPEKAQCRSCAGLTENVVGTVAAPVAGKTDPAKAMSLVDCLVNQQFAEAVCPICVEPMELKHLFHNDSHGPGHWTQSSKGPVWVQDAVGETAVHQCNRCKATVTMATTALHVFKRINEPRPGRQINSWLTEAVGVRDEHEIGPVEGTAA